LTILIAASVQDLAAENIVDKLQHIIPFKVSDMVFDGFPILRSGSILLARTRSDSIYTSGLDEIPGVESIIFASRHSSSSGQATLTVHATGNPLNEAKYGGNPQSLGIADPNRMKAALSVLESEVLEENLPYNVSLEATHHGPTEMNVAVMFVEIGSEPIQWGDPLAGEAAAKAIVKAVRDDLALRVEQLETEVAALNQSDETLRRELQSARRLKGNAHKQERIRSKIDELLAKLEGI